jgi:NADH pyrophosphatase NudC (nudix superfamily)
MLYAAAIVIVLAVGLFVVAPMLEVSADSGEVRVSERLAAFEHERSLAMQALRELELDREMNKLSAADYTELKGGLETRALRAMAAIEGISGTDRPQLAAVRRAPASQSARLEIRHASQRTRFCPQCGAQAVSNAKFCAECGRSLASQASASQA